MKKNKKKQVVRKKPAFDFHAHSVEKVFEQVKSSKDGLTQEQANVRLEKNGLNELPSKKPKNFFLMLLEEFLNPIVLILFVAMAFSLAVKEWIDAGVIFAIVLVDAIIGAIQSKKAQRVASSLSSMIKVKSKVLRDGNKIEVDSKNLVVGDVVFLESGDKISADMRIIECSNFTVDESLLTGESLNAVKLVNAVSTNAVLGDRTSMVYSGSSVITGRAKCVVVATGIDTEIGSIATNLNDVKDEKSPLTIRIEKFSKQISIMVFVAAVIIFLIMLLQHNPAKDIFIVVIALSVSAMPEGLPLAVTMALTIASNRMAKENVVVKHLNAVESLGSCTVIATDKTGTLTLNEQTAKVVTLPNNKEFLVEGSGYNDKGKVKCDDSDSLEFVKNIATMGVINNESQFKKDKEGFSYFGDSIDIAFKVLGAKMHVNGKNLEIRHRIPYESENKYSAVFFKSGKETYCTVKGSLEKILEFSSSMRMGTGIVSIDKDQIVKQNDDLAKRGYRVIALAVGKVENADAYSEKDISNLTFIGLVSFIDPVRIESKKAIKECHEAGIKVIMITGDHPLTAYSIAQDIEIANDMSQIATGKEVAKAFELGEKEFDKFVKTKSVFSRVTPTDKLNIVNSLKRQGEFVAVTGDGVNDSPAIKSAHIGIAMGSGTDVSKETADMIILDDNFNSIISGIKEGRCAYSNIRKIVYFLITTSIAEVLFFVLALVSGSKAPLIAIQLLWLNIVTDGFQDLSLSFENPEPNIMKEKPRPTKESLFTKSMISQCLFMGGFIGIVVYVTWLVLLQNFGTSEEGIQIARTFVMALMVFMENIHALNCRSEKQSLFKTPAFSNPFFIFSIGISIGFQILFMEVPALGNLLELTTVSYGTLGILLLVSLSVFVVGELYKVVYRSILKKKEQKLIKK